MRLEDDYCYHWVKGHREPISKDFDCSEYTCHCTFDSCVDQKINKQIVERNQKIRDALGTPLQITSGYRCSAYQAALKARGLETAAGVSQHELGNASDIAATDMSQLYVLCEKLYYAIGKASHFIHVDLRPPHEDGTKRLWSYSK